MQLRHQLLGLRRDARELVAELFLVPPAGVVSGCATNARFSSSRCPLVQIAVPGVNSESPGPRTSVSFCIPCGGARSGVKLGVAARRRRVSMVAGGRQLAGCREPRDGTFIVALSTRIRFCCPLTVPAGSHLPFTAEGQGGAGCCRRHDLPARDAAPARQGRATGVDRILKTKAAKLTGPGSETHWLPNWLPKLRPKNTSDQSGRRDLNPRPLDPQDGGVGIFAAQPGRGGIARCSITCGLSGRARSVWSPNGPQRWRLLRYCRWPQRCCAAWRVTPSRAAISAHEYPVFRSPVTA